MIPQPTSTNRDRLVRTARRIAPLLDEVVFVGGQMAELLVTDPAAARVRPTDDVDVIVRVTTRTAYHQLQQRLGELGFAPDMRDGAPLCRVRTQDDLVLDAMPLDEDVLGFTNRWYPLAIETAVPLRIAPDVEIRAIAAPAFLATKWEAFRHRGAADPLMSHDLEDIITVVAGRPGVVTEVSTMPPDVREFIAASTSTFMEDRWAEDIVAGSVVDSREFPQLADVVLERLRELAAGRHGSVRRD